MSIRIILVLIPSLILFIQSVQTQILIVDPPSPSVDDDVTIIYNAAEGNGELFGYTGNVYAHTGVITSQSNGPGDWKYVKTEWCQNLEAVQLKSLGDDKYSISYNIREYYGIPEDEEVVQLAFVFRSENCDLVGRDTTNADIFYQLGSPEYKVIGNYASHQILNNELSILDTDSNTISILRFRENIFKITCTPRGESGPDSSLLTILRPEKNIDVTLVENEGTLELSNGAYTLVVNKTPLYIDLLRGDEKLLAGNSLAYTQNRNKKVFFELSSDEQIFGLGSHAIPMDRKGRYLNLYNQQKWGYTWETPNLNITIPFYTSSNSYGVFFDNHHDAYLDIGSSTADVLEYGTRCESLAYYIILGDGYAEIVSEYTRLTGRQPLPPRWALGYIQSRFGYETETEARQIVQTMLDEHFPMDALILDLYWFGNPGDMGNLDWDLDRYPQPVQMISDFKNLGVETILITEPYITEQSNNFNSAANTGLLAKDLAGDDYVISDFWAGPAGLLDMFKPEVQDWMWNFYNERIQEGVSGWWCDLGEPENHPRDIRHINGTAAEVHNIYSLEWAKFLFDQYQQNYPDQRLFNLIRSGFAGMQRYSAIPWSGDVARSFEGLKAQIPIMLGMSMSGVGYMHSDAGGFAGGTKNSELYSRWLQFSAFTPIMRPHGFGIPTEPIFYDENTKNIVRDIANLRHQLLPYNYSLAWENSTSGMPLARPLVYTSPVNTPTNFLDSEYLWGDAFLVAPILEEGQIQREVYLPEGNWINYWNENIYTGNTIHSIQAPLNQIPLFIRSGSIIPMSLPFQTHANYSTDTLLVRYYLDHEEASSSFTMYDDDGTTPNANITGQFKLLQFNAAIVEDHLNMILSQSGNGFTGMPEQRHMIFQIHQMTEAPDQVMINKTPLALENISAVFDTLSQGAYWNNTTQILMVKFNWQGNQDTISINGIGFTSALNEQNLSTIDYNLFNPYPNPFSSELKIQYEVKAHGIYGLEIRDLLGRQITSLNQGFHQPGVYQVTWQSHDDPSGVYILSLKSAGSVQNKKVILSK